MWTRLGDQLIERDIYDKVVLIPFAWGGSEIASWRPGGGLHPELIKRIRNAISNGLSFTHLLWHQGENDAGQKTSKEAYQQAFRAMLDAIRAEGVMAPVYVSVASRCRASRPNPAVQNAQMELIDQSLGIYQGPNTDVLGLEFRFDGCHFTNEGLDEASKLWVDAIIRSSPSIAAAATIPED